MLLVFGGSQGAQSLNTAVAGAATDSRPPGSRCCMRTARRTPSTCRPPPAERAAPFDKAPYIAVPYLSRIELAYAAADLAICRSGAMTVAEVSAVGLPAFYVPLPHGNGEQELNARPVVAQGGGKIVPDAQLTSQYVIDHVVRPYSTGRGCRRSARPPRARAIAMPPARWRASCWRWRTGSSPDARGE